MRHGQKFRIPSSMMSLVFSFCSSQFKCNVERNHGCIYANSLVCREIIRISFPGSFSYHEAKAHTVQFPLLTPCSICRSCVVTGCAGKLLRRGMPFTNNFWFIVHACESINIFSEQKLLYYTSIGIFISR
jgi:hypothetical protein